MEDYQYWSADSTNRWHRLNILFNKVQQIGHFMPLAGAIRRSVESPLEGSEQAKKRIYIKRIKTNKPDKYGGPPKCTKMS